MMNVTIKHHTRYDYTDNVFLEPHVLRLIPRPDSHIRIVSLSIAILPEPAGISDMIETDGTVAKSIWFNHVSQALDIATDMVLIVEHFDPFNFLIDPLSCVLLPLIYPPHWMPLLVPYLVPGDEQPRIKAFARECAYACDFETVGFLVTLCTRIHDEFMYKKRENDPPRAPQETLRLKRGSCRDFAVFAMAVCRCLGIASRFVSGYCLHEAQDSPEDLHAWIETFLPGVGWKGFDPSRGLACNNRYVALSASADPVMTMPVSGTFRGDAASRMNVDLVIEQNE